MFEKGNARSQQPGYCNDCNGSAQGFDHHTSMVSSDFKSIGLSAHVRLPVSRLVMSTWSEFVHVSLVWMRSIWFEWLHEIAPFVLQGFLLPGVGTQPHCLQVCTEVHFQGLGIGQFWGCRLAFDERTGYMAGILVMTWNNVFFSNKTSQADSKFLGWCFASPTRMG